MNGWGTTTMRETVDPALMPYYREASATGLQFLGLSVMHHERDIRRLVVTACGKDTPPSKISVLDYGSGRGMQWKRERLHEKLGVSRPTQYDPGVAGLETKPEGTFTGVICSDVLEHVPEHLVENLLAEVFEYAEKFVWLSVCCRAAKKRFPDGTNLHVTVRPREWWQDKVNAAAALHPNTHVHLVFTD